MVCVVGFGFRFQLLMFEVKTEKILFSIKIQILANTIRTLIRLFGRLDLSLFWKSHSATCSPVYLILHHVTGSCKGHI